MARGGRFEPGRESSITKSLSSTAAENFPGSKWSLLSEPVRVAAEGCDLGLMDEPVKRATLVGLTSPQRPRDLLEVTIRLTRPSGRKDDHLWADSHCG